MVLFVLYVILGVCVCVCVCGYSISSSMFYWLRTVDRFGPDFSQVDGCCSFLEDVYFFI